MEPPQVAASADGPALAPDLASPLHLQTIFEAGKGNALQACVATALGVPRLEDVPNFVDAPDYHVALSEFLARNAPKLSFVKVELVTSEEGSASTAPKLPFPTGAGTVCVVAGKSPRGSHKHCVVGRVLADMRTLEVLHDPFPGGGGLEAPFAWAGFFALRDASR